MSGVRYPPVPSMDTPMEPPQQGAAAPPQPPDRNHASASTSGSTGVWMPWTVPGVLGGLLVGATAGGPVGAVVGGLAGALAGVFRDVTGKTAVQAFLEAPEADKRKMLAQAGFLLLGTSQAASGGGGSGGGDDAPGLTADELDSLPAAPAADGEPVCVLCMSSAVQVVFQPCGHAQVCGKCAAQVLRMAYTGACPMCRTKIQRISRVFISAAAAAAPAAPAPARAPPAAAPGAPPAPRAPSAPPAPSMPQASGGYK